MKNRLLYGIIFLIMIVTIVLVPNRALASMIDYTDEQAYNDYLKEQNEWNEAHKDSINKSSNNYLKSISIENYEISPSFERQTVDYSVTRTVDSDTINIRAEAEDEKASVSGIGEIKLNSGENNLRIDVTAESGTVRTYFIKVNKVVKQNLRLQSLQLKASDNEIKLDPEFSSDVFSYSCNVENYVNDVDVNALANSENVDINISGNKDLKEGLNTVIITLNKSGDTENVSYKINIFKQKSVEEDDDGNEEDNSIEYKKSNRNFILILVLILLVLLIFVFIIKKCNKNKGQHSK